MHLMAPPAGARRPLGSPQRAPPLAILRHPRVAQLLGQTVHPAFVRWPLLLPGAGHVFLVISGHVVSTLGLDARAPCGDGAHTMRPTQRTRSRRTPTRFAPLRQVAWVRRRRA